MEALGINVPGLLAQLINFALLFVVLWFLLYKPITRMLDQRAERIRESMEQAEHIKRELERVEAAVQQRLEEARHEGQNLVAQATQVGERMREESRAEARREAEAIIARARVEIQMERDEAIAQLREQFAELTILAASKVINQSLDRTTHQRLIEEVLAESKGLGS